MGNYYIRENEGMRCLGKENLCAIDISVVFLDLPPIKDVPRSCSYYLLAIQTPLWIGL